MKIFLQLKVNYLVFGVVDFCGIRFNPLTRQQISGKCKKTARAFENQVIVRKDMECRNHLKRKKNIL